MAAPMTVLFVHYGEDWLRGSEILLLDLMRNLDPGRVRPVVWCNAPAMERACREAGLPVERDDFVFYLDHGSPAPDPWRWAKLVAKGRNLIRRHGAAVVHANSAAPAQWMVPAARLARRPLLLHLHIAYLRRGRYVLLQHQADLAVGVSGQVLEGLRADGMDPARLRVIPNGIDPARLRPSGGDVRVECGIAPDAPVIATIGSLIPRKGHDVLLRALVQLPGVTLLVGGEGPQRAELEALAAAFGVAERVRFLGQVDDVAKVIQAADIFALASRHESFGLVLAEAGWFGRPVVAARSGGIAEVVAEGETGLLVPRDDPAALAAALGRLLADPAMRARMGEAGRARVEQRFTVGRMADGFEAAYAELAEGPRRRAAAWRPYLRMG
ncbi:MAG: glycosyltransferase family 4 protein [Acetobacteraceae bacterium]|nr:glycosyltransferase family 4 protein [Acetobacteraceae bacterium]